MVCTFNTVSQLFEVLFLFSDILKVDINKKSLNAIMQNRGLAGLGDSYVNFIYSLAKSKVARKPLGGRVRSKVLAEALKSSGLRIFISDKRLSSHELGDVAESLIVYCWLNNLVSLEEAVSTLSSKIDNKNLITREKEWKDCVSAFTLLLLRIKEILELK